MSGGLKLPTAHQYFGPDAGFRYPHCPFCDRAPPSLTDSGPKTPAPISIRMRPSPFFVGVSTTVVSVGTILTRFPDKQFFCIPARRYTCPRIG